MKWQVILITPEIAALDHETLVAEAHRRGYAGAVPSFRILEWAGVGQVALGMGGMDTGPSELVPSGLTVVAEYESDEAMRQAITENAIIEDEE